MSKEVQMTFRLEPELRAEFSNAAMLEDRPAAHVLREFMQTYVNQSRERDHGQTKKVISQAERRRREAAVNFARASVGLEGFKPSKAAENDARLVIKGDLQLVDFVRVNPDAEQSDRS